MQARQNQNFSQDEINLKLLEKLTVIFSNVNEWLKYAETKNSVILTFCGVSITAIITYLTTSKQVLQSLKIGLLISIIFLFISTVIVSLSFLPKTDLDQYAWKLLHKSKNMQPDINNDNLYFFGHLKKYIDLRERKPNAEQLLSTITKVYLDIDPQNINNTQNQLIYKKEAQDLCLQLIINSDITATKFWFSEWSIRIAIIAIIVIPLCMIISLIVFHHF